MVWKFDLAGNLLESKDLGVEGMQQGTKVPEKNLFHNIIRYIYLINFSMKVKAKIKVYRNCIQSS